MAIENRFASEEYVLNELQNYEDTHKPNWEENDTESDSYIKNKTHFQEVITYEWDGNEDGYEVVICAEDSNIKYIKISDDIPDMNDFSIFGVCECCAVNDDGSDGNVLSSDLIEDVSTALVNFGKKIVTAPVNRMVLSSFKGWSHSVCMYTSYLDQGYDLGQYSFYSSCRVIVMYENGKYRNTSLTAGVYFTKGILGYNNQCERTVKYSYIKYKKIDRGFIEKDYKNLVEKNASFNNKILGVCGHVEGINNYGGLLLEGDECSNFKEYAIPKAFHLEGYQNKLISDYSHVEGANNSVTSSNTGLHVEGTSNTVSERGSYSDGDGAHIEGRGNNVKIHGTGSFGGYYNNGYLNNGDSIRGERNELGINGSSRNVSGYSNKVISGSYIDISGYSNEASHSGSVIRGQYNKSGAAYQTVLGQYNEVFEDSIFDVGNGDSTFNRKTAFSVKKDGSAKLQLQGTTEDSITRKDYVDTRVQNAKEETIKDILNITNAIDSWESVQKIVRKGYAPLIFKIGDQLVCNHSEFGELTWDIIGFDHDSPADSQYTHSMTLQLHDVLDTVPREFDAKEALFCATEEIGPGKYYLVYNTKIDDSGTNTYLTFTVPENLIIPVNGLIVNLATAGNTFSVIENCFSKDTPLGSFTVGMTVTQPTDATYLGKSNYHRSWAITNGSSNYVESCIRFYLNGDSEYLEWEPQHNCDMPPSYITDTGFMHGLDEDFKKVLGKVIKNSYDALNYTINTFEDFIFLPSRTEIYGGCSIDYSGNEIIDGTPYEYYINNSDLTAPGTRADTNRIKYDAITNTAQSYYLRSIYSPSAAQASTSSILNRTASITPTGLINQTPVNINPNVASTAKYLVPCCCIV